jgi:hypothetical protein
MNLILPDLPDFEIENAAKPFCKASTPPQADGLLTLK